LLTELSYNNLEVQNGAMALEVEEEWYSMIILMTIRKRFG